MFLAYCILILAGQAMCQTDKAVADYEHKFEYESFFPMPTTTEKPVYVFEFRSLYQNAFDHIECPMKDNTVYVCNTKNIEDSCVCGYGSNAKVETFHSCFGSSPVHGIRHNGVCYLRYHVKFPQRKYPGSSDLFQKLELPFKIESLNGPIEFFSFIFHDVEMEYRVVHFNCVHNTRNEVEVFYELNHPHCADSVLESLLITNKADFNNTTGLELLDWEVFSNHQEVLKYISKPLPELPEPSLAWYRLIAPLVVLLVVVMFCAPWTRIKKLLNRGNQRNADGNV